MKRNLGNASLNKKDKGPESFKMFDLIISYKKFKKKSIKVIRLGECYISTYNAILYACFLFYSLNDFVTWRSVKYKRPVTN